MCIDRYDFFVRGIDNGIADGNACVRDARCRDNDARHARRELDKLAQTLAESEVATADAGASVATEDSGAPPSDDEESKADGRGASRAIGK